MQKNTHYVKKQTKTLTWGRKRKFWKEKIRKMRTRTLREGSKQHPHQGQATQKKKERAGKYPIRHRLDRRSGYPIPRRRKKKHEKILLHRLNGPSATLEQVTNWGRRANSPLKQIKGALQGGNTKRKTKLTQSMNAGTGQPRTARPEI